MGNDLRYFLSGIAMRIAASLCVLGLLLANVVAANAQTQSTAVSADQDASGSDENDGDVGWPREIATPAGSIVVYQPQVDEMTGPNITGRAAFSLRAKPEDEPDFGALWFEARVNADTEERLAYVDNVTITKVAMPEASKEQNDKLAKAIEAGAAKGAVSISLDRLAVALKEAQTERKEAEGLDNSPPKIIIKNVPAVLLYVDGKPKLGAVEGSDVLAMENTPFPIVLDPASKKYYLNGGTIWYEASDIKGPWKYIEKVPQKISALIKLTEEQKKDLIELVGTDDDDRIPEIVYSDVPSELIVIDGKPSFTPLVGADLLYVENSETSLFLDPGTKKYYVLLSGRWYVNDAMQEKGWAYVPSGDLPEAFAKIPEDSDRSAVLSQIVGTEQAEEAIAEASIPQVTAISRKEASLKVSYGGKPQFEPIKGTKMQYAVNTSTTVLLIDGLYYAVDQGVWYVAEGPNGPWAVADEVPDQVEDIPADNPAYNVKYVKVYDSTPEYVYVGYTPGYVGSYVYGGTVVYGTGYYYPAWWGRYFYPRPLTWTLGAFFRPWVGWGYGVGWGRFHFHAGFGPGYGWHRRRGGWYGPGGFHSHRYNRYRAKHHRVSHYRSRNNIYNRPRNRNRNQFKNTRPNRNDLRRDFKGAKNRPNNVFTDRKGNVYRKNKNGNWQKRDGKNWKNTKLDRDKRPGSKDKRPGNLDKKRPGAGDKTRPAAGNKNKRPAAGNKAKKPQKGKAKNNKKAKPQKKKAKTQKKAKPRQKNKTRSKKKQSARPQQRRQRSSNSMQRHSRSRNRGAQRSRSHSQARRRPRGGGRRGGGGGRRGGGRR